VEHADFQKLIGACEKLLADQDQLIANLKAEGRDLTDALHLRTQIVNLLSKIRSTHWRMMH
jgi:hypothetical protein